MKERLLLAVALALPLSALFAEVKGYAHDLRCRIQSECVETDTSP